MGAGASLARLERDVLRALPVRGYLGAAAALRVLVERDDVEAIVARLMAMTPPETLPTLRAALIEAWSRGAASAVGIIGAMPDVASPIVTADSMRAAALGAVPAAVATLDRRLAIAVRQAQTLAQAGAPASVMATPVLGAATSLRATVVTSITEVGNRSVRQLADLARLPTVWVAETDACVDCLAYSGQVAQPGDGFPAGRTFGAASRARSTGPLVAPPLHPNCRCEVEPLGDDEYAEALRREAERSVLRGFSLESESMATRVDAARRLLANGVDAPASVIAYAERAVSAGKFRTRS